MASTHRAPRLARSTTTGGRTRPEAETRRLAGLTTTPVNVPQPRDTADSMSSGHPIMHWVMVTDDNGRARPEARWL
jgi:hypothetical protein